MASAEVRTKIERRYANDKANAWYNPDRDVDEWLAGVSYADWFTLCAENQRFRDALTWIAEQAGPQGCGLRECEEIASGALA